MKLAVVVAVGEQLGNGERGAAEEDLVGGSGAVAVPHLEADARVGDKEVLAAAGADVIPEGVAGARLQVRRAGDAAGAVLNGQRQRHRGVLNADGGVGVGRPGERR